MLKKHSYPVFCTAMLGTLLTLSPLSVAGEQDVYIPENTLFYVGTGAPMPVDHLFSLMPDFTGIRDTEDGDSSLQAMADYLDNPAGSLAAWGIEGEVAFSAYTVGISPVFRVSLSDPARFKRSLKDYELKRNLTSEELEEDGRAVKVYSLESLKSSGGESTERDNSADGSTTDSMDKDAAATDAASADSATTNTVASTGSGSSAVETAADDAETSLSMVVGISDADVVFGFVTDADDIQSIRSVLGITRPETSIEADGKLNQLRKKWGYGDEVASFIDFEQIAAVLTDETNAVAQQLQASGLLNGRMLGNLEQMRSEPCRAEITQLVANWPRTVAGYRDFEVSEKQVEFDTHAAVVVGHEQLRETLKLFRGLLPSSQSSGEPMLSLGLGLTVDNLAQALGQLNEMAASVRYQCQALYPLNAIAASDLSAVSMGVVMFGGMARGVRGMSLNVFDVDVDPAAGASALKAIDTAMAISADNPSMLLGTLKMLPQFAALGDLPQDGSEVDVTGAFPLPLPPDVQIKAAMKGNNIVLYSGEKSTDFANRLAQNEAEGFFRGKANTRLILEKLSSSMANIGGSDSRQQVTEILDRYLQGELMYSLEFTDNGIEIVSKGLVDRRDASGESAK